MSFILHVKPNGVSYGYRANDNITFVQEIARPDLATFRHHNYLYESGRRDKVQAYFAIGNFDAVHAVEDKLMQNTCLTLDKIRTFIGKSNITVVVIADGRVCMINKNATMSQIIPNTTLTFTFGDVDTSCREFADAEFTKLDYIQHTVDFWPEAPFN
jgi:hypothetical protein